MPPTSSPAPADRPEPTAVGRLIHDGGVLPVPGIYVLGLPFLRRRRSSFIDGVGPDAREPTVHLESAVARA